MNFINAIAALLLVMVITIAYGAVLLFDRSNVILTGWLFISAAPYVIFALVFYLVERRGIVPDGLLSLGGPKA